MLRKDFQTLSATRAKEARALSQAGLHDGAYYLGGLAVENALKACVARATERYEFPDRDRANRVYTHKLEGLLNEAGLRRELQVASPSVRASWSTVKEWAIDARYESGRTRLAVEDFLQAVVGRDGVLRWLRRFW